MSGWRRPGGGARVQPGAVQRVQAALRALQAGRDTEESFRIVFDTYFEAVEAFFRRRLASEQDCQDLTQEVFLALVQNVGSFRWQAPFEVWLLGLLRNHFRRHLRRKGRLRAVEGSLPEGEAALAALPAVETLPFRSRCLEDDEPIADLLRREGRRVLLEAMRELPERCRHCVQLRLFHDLSYGEIAAVLGISEATVKVQMHRARQKLKPRLEPYFERALPKPRAGEGTTSCTEGVQAPLSQGARPRRARQYVAGSATQRERMDSRPNAEGIASPALSPETA